MWSDLTKAIKIKCKFNEGGLSIVYNEQMSNQNA